MAIGDDRPRNPAYVAVGRRIYRERVKAGLSREELGDRLGYGKHSVRNWESGTRGGEWHLPAIAEALGIPVSQLMED